ncbi:sulfotransferase family 2 domain-containing protein [Lutibaculum baratangense]|uniref:Sulfotransferase family protein n=1 Tax=Lutibaculum baratangense AMV1 TaxID=631454 RepID=V4REP2_9HYPH|nr:sulfotransferase family 2 domain-containing protein [Lutibaculum baratangense]ESR23849.1 hypothetical protein N177_2794 [Lutibaculum baratangense AMV1]
MASPPPEFDDPLWLEALLAARSIGKGRVAVPQEFRSKVPRSVGYQARAAALLLNKGQMHLLPLERLRQLLTREVAFANPVFVLFTQRPAHPGPLDPHVEAVRSFVRDAEERRFRGRQTVFLHIPKTAGTSLRHALDARYQRPVYFMDNGELWRARGSLDAFDFVAGHFNMLALRTSLYRPHTFTLIRDPYERLISAVAHARRPDIEAKTLNWVMRLWRELPLSEILQLHQGQKELFMQERLLCGSWHPTADQQDHLARTIRIGLVERMDLFLDQHGAAFGLGRAAIGRHNATSNRCALVSSEEIATAYAMHSRQIERSRDFYRGMRDRVESGIMPDRPASSLRMDQGVRALRLLQRFGRRAARIILDPH